MRGRALGFEQLLKRVKGEFAEMPGLRLTIEQSSRLWGLDRAKCEAVLSALLDRKFLSKADGKYGRTNEGMAPDLRRRPAKAILEQRPITARSAGTPEGRRAGERSWRD
jgi:hypothetical protein